MIFYLISRKHTTFSELSYLLSVSRNTILKDLSLIKKNLPSTLSLKDYYTKSKKRVANIYLGLNMISVYGHMKFSTILKITDESKYLLSFYLMWNTNRYLQGAILQNVKSLKAINYLTHVWANSLVFDLNIDNPKEAMSITHIVSTQPFYHISSSDSLLHKMFPITAKIIHRFDKISGAHIPYNTDSELNYQLSVHLISTFCRIKYYVSYHNPLLKNKGRL